MGRNDGVIMNIPETIKIGAYDYKMIEEDKLKLDGKDVWGYCDREQNKIYMQKGMKSKKEKEVFLHECLHAIEESYGISLGERKVNILGLALMALISDNKLRF